MTRDPDRVIEEYLERVKVYLPLGSEDTLTEIRTHILDSAERIGEGKVTEGSVIMAIERIGEPQRVANEYAGTGEKVGPVPAEYVQPLFRILLTLLAISIALIIGLNVVGIAFDAFIDLSVLPYYFPIVVVLNVFIVVSIIALISLIVDRDKRITERTTLEAIFGAGSEGFKPKGRLDAAGEVFFGFLWALVIILPPVLAALNPAILLPMVIAAFLLLIGSVKGSLFYTAGENNLNLLFEALLSIAWIILALFLAGVPYPMDKIYYNTNGVWMTMTVEELTTLVPIDVFDLTIVFAIGWSIFIFILVVTNVWRVLVSVSKISLYLRDGKGWWWQGGWGKPQYRRSRWYKRFFAKDDNESEEYTTYTDGYTGNE